MSESDGINWLLVIFAGVVFLLIGIAAGALMAFIDARADAGFCRQCGHQLITGEYELCLKCEHAIRQQVEE